MRTDQEALEEACAHQVDIVAGKFLRKCLLVGVLLLLGIGIVVGLVWHLS